jgi:hypothetical protein
MIFLWAFGNAVCAKVGNGWFPLIYVGLGVLAGVSHLLVDVSPVVGASGAINGIVGMYLIFYPLNDVTMFYFIFLRPGTTELSGYWVIAMWFVFDVWGMLAGGGGVAYAAHVGGLVFGCALGVALLLSGLVRMDKDEKSLLEVLGMKVPREEPEPRPFTPHPAMPTPAAPRSVPAAAADAVDDRVRFSCACGNSLVARKRFAGREAKCPKCAATVRVPGA